MLNATSDYSLLSTYATRKADGSLTLLVINKNSSTNLDAQITLTNFSPWSTATVRSFGIAQDEATRTNSIIAVTGHRHQFFRRRRHQFHGDVSAVFIDAGDICPRRRAVAVFDDVVWPVRLSSSRSVRGSLCHQTSPDLVNWIPVSTNLLPIMC